MQRFRIADHKIFHTGGRDYLFLAEDNAIFEMDTDTRNLIARCESRNEFGREDISALISGSEQEKSELFGSLLNCRVIIPKDRATPEYREAGSVPLKTLVLHVTDACNLACLYCYHSREKREPAPRASMEKDVAKKAVDFLLAHSGPLEEVVLVFFGGEPLLCFDLITVVVPYALEKASEKGKKISFAITTNGTLLNEKIISFLYENQVSVTISIDGSEDRQNHYRPFPDGSPSYPVIAPRLKKILGRSWEKPVVARVTLARNPNNLSDMLDHLLGLGFSEAGFAPATTRDSEYQLNDEAMAVLSDQFGSLGDRFLKSACNGEFLGFTNLIDLLVTLHEGEVKNYPCGAGLGLFSVDPRGRLYLCQRFTGQDAFCMGDIFGGFDLPKIDRFRMQTEIHQKHICKTCWARAGCAGGCYHEAWVRQGDITLPNRHYCEWIKKWMETGLEIYGQLSAQHPEYLDKLALLRGHAPIFGQFL